MTKNIEQYLNTQPYIRFSISKEELESKNIQRYFALLTYVGQHPTYAKKFCGKFLLSFRNFTQAELFHSCVVRKFVRELNSSFPFLFFLAEKEGETLKLLTILECSTGENKEENFALDQRRFATYLKAQTVGLIKMADLAGFTSAQAQLIIKQVQAYFGLIG